MDQKTLRDFEAKCTQDEAPACQSSCPIHLDARAFIKYMAEKNLKKARIELDKYMPLSTLSALLCEGDCQKACRMQEKGEAIDMPLLERTCVLNTEATKIMAIVSNGKKIAIAGSALSSLCLAYEMAKKGFNVSLYHVGAKAKSLLEQAGSRLNPLAIEKALEILISLKVEFIEIEKFDTAWINNVLEEKLALYLGEDDAVVSSACFDIEKENNSYTSNHISLTTSREKVVSGGTLEGQTNFCKAIADSKRAMNSIVRILQNVSPHVAREAEAPYKTKLFTNIDDYEILKKNEVKDFLNPSLEEATLEAKRCVQCSCLECVKQCTYMQHYKTYPKKALREAYNNLAIAQGHRSANTMINSCTQCGLCAKICPNDLNLGDFIEEVRAEMVKMKHMPPSAHEFALEDMAFSNSKEVQFYKEQVGSRSTKYVFFPGCQLPAVLPYEVQKAYEYLAQELEGGVAFHLACCGMPASWAQSTKYLDKHLECITKNWQEHNKPTYIFACASCQDFYKKYIPEMNILSLWEVLKNTNFVASNSLHLSDKLALHDPCSSRDFPLMQESVRSLLSSLKQDIEELEFGKEQTRCCGFGGLASHVNESLANTFADQRNKDTDTDLLVYCAICRERMQKVGKPSLHILELLFPSSSAEELKTRKNTALLSLFERQEKRLNFRKSILKEIWNKEEMENPSDIQFTLVEGLEEILSQRRVLHADIARVLQEASKKGPSFYSEETKEHLACYRPRQVTYWVRYRKESDNFIVTDAYSHRMVVPGVQGEGELASYFQEVCCK